MGREIVEVEQRGEQPAGYGDEVIERLAKRRARRLGQGFGARTLRRILVDLKLGKLTHQDLGQMQMYVNYFDQFHRAEHEVKTIGIVLCSEKNDAMARITLPDNEQIRAVRYQMYLPSEEELRAELARARESAERALRLAAAEAKDPNDTGVSPGAPRAGTGR